MRIHGQPVLIIFENMPQCRVYYTSWEVKKRLEIDTKVECSLSAPKICPVFASPPGVEICHFRLSGDVPVCSPLVIGHLVGKFYYVIWVLIDKIVYVHSFLIILGSYNLTRHR